MKQILHRSLAVAAWCGFTGSLLADLPYAWHPQPDLSVSNAAADTWHAGWQGVNARTYLMQWSLDMEDWQYFPVTREGAGDKSYGFTSSNEAFFLRLEYNDEIPALGEPDGWQPAVLAIAGQWKVVTRDANGNPLPGVNLAFHRWPDGAPTPLATPHHHAVTTNDGTYLFDPLSVSPGDRVEVRMTRDPGQRVYLPWQPGNDNPGSEITPGGQGATPVPMPAGRGTGQTPLPPGQPPSDNPDMPVYRLHDFLLFDYQDEFYGRAESPFGFHEIKEEIRQGNNTTSELRATPDDTSNWEIPFNLGFAFVIRGDESQDDDVDGIEYTAEFTSAFGHHSAEVPVNRNVFVEISDDSADIVPYPNPLYPPMAITFKDGVLHQWGDAQLPYDFEEVADHLNPPSDPQNHQGGNGTPEALVAPGELYRRILVLGPVPAYVPLSVMSGEPFFYSGIAGPDDEDAQEGTPKSVRLHTELPLGCSLQSFFKQDPQDGGRVVPAKILWSAELDGPSGLQMTLNTANRESPAPGTSLQLEAKPNEAPVMWVEFVNTAGPEHPVQTAFSVTIAAAVMVASTETPDANAPGGFSYTYNTHELGSFTTQFTPVYRENQPGELNGSATDAPESDGLIGGQRVNVIDPERRIGVTGKPAPSSPTFVDAMTGRFHHGETDFSLPIPGSDLSLSVTRTARETIWTDAFGTHPAESVTLPFGPGWSGNLAAFIERVSHVGPDGTADAPGDPHNLRSLLGRLTVRDYQGKPFTFLEYRDASGETSLLPAPTLLPDPAHEGISLEPGENDTLILRQPALGMQHVYQATGIDFMIANNRDVPVTGGHHPSGFTSHQYHRLASVTDRFGVTLGYQYGEAHPGNLIPHTIAVDDRPELAIRILQEGGRVTAFWDPSGVRHSYTYESRDLAGDQRDPAPVAVLKSHQAGHLTSATYDYTFHTEEDPRPVEMLRPRAGGGHYRIPTHHYALDHIENGRGDAITIHYHQSDARKAWSDAATAHYPVAGDPLMVGEIHLPGSLLVEIDYQHVLQNAAPGHAANHTLVTEVTTIRGDEWRYEFTEPQSFSWQVDAADAAHLPSAGALVFGKLTRTCVDVADSEVTFTYCPAAGFAPTETLDAAARSSQATYEEPFAAPNPFYQAPEISPGLTLFSRHRLPTTTTNRLGHSTHFQYIHNPGAPDHLRIDTITDHRERTIIHGYGAHARTESIHIEQDETTLARIEYGHTNTDIPGAITRVTRKAIAASGDPSWVADLVTDIRLDANGFPDRIGNDQQNLHTHLQYSPSGRLLETTAPNGGTRSYQYDSAGLHETTHLENGAVLRNWRDDAGHVVFRRDALGHATGIERDGLGRVTRTVRDMNGTLGFLAAGTLTGVDPDHDIITTTAYLDAEREIRTTDPRGHITIHRFDALGRTTRIIAPGNQRAPATLPTEQEDRLTTFDYDILESPSHPVKTTDPLGHDTHFLFDEFARLEMVLREYGQDPVTTAPLHAGTATTYHPDTGLPETTTAIRTPLDHQGEPIGQATIESLTTRILRDALDRPQTVIHGDGTDKELHHAVRHTSTGIPHRWQTRLAPAHGQTPEQWSTWEIECDALGRTTKLIAPAIIESITQQPVTPTTGYHYGPDGLLRETTDSLNHTTTYGHDILGLPAWVRQPAVFDAKSGEEIHPHTAWHRDANGLVTRVIDPLGYAWTHQRDPAGRVATSTGPVVHPHATGGEHRRRPVWHRTYDAAGNPATVTDAEGRVRTYDYYPDGHLESTTLHVNFIDEYGDDEILPVTEQYIRDDLGRVTRVIDGAGQATAFTHDGLHRILTITRDPDDSRAKTETTTYDALLPLTRQDAIGTIREYHHDSQFRLHRIEFPASPGEDLQFTHDHTGRLTAIAPIVPPASGQADPAVAFAHNALGLPEWETSNGVTTHYGYDANARPARTTNTLTGRIVTTQYGTPASGHNSNQLHTLVETPGGGPPATTSYTYDSNGNRETRTRGTATDHYGYDSLDRLTTHTLNTAASAENGEWQYQYDPLTRRIARHTPGHGTRHFAYSGHSPAHEWEDAAPAAITSHIGGGVAGRLHTHHPSAPATHPFHNTRGDVVAEFTAAGNLASHTTRQADGLPEDIFGTPTSHYGPNGKWQEPGHLVNDGFRHRDLHTATFLSRDPAGFIDGPNHYNYVAHNPWSAFDPHGLATTLQIPDGTNDIGYVTTTITNNDPLIVSAPPDPSQGTVGAATPYGAPAPPRGPPAGHDPVTTAAITNLLEASIDPVGYSDRRSGITVNISIPNLPGGLSEDWFEIGDQLSEEIIGPAFEHFTSTGQTKYEAANWRMILSVRYMHAGSREITTAAESSKYPPEQSRYLMNWSHRRNLSEFDASIVSGTFTGIETIADIAIPFIPPIYSIAKGTHRAGTGARYAFPPPRSSPPLGGSAADGAARTGGRTNAPLVQEVATRADAWGARQGLGLGSRAGTLKHGYADELLTRYQNIYGQRGLQTETSWLGNAPATYGTRGSVRLDVWEPATGTVFDYKFGNAVLSPAQVNKITTQSPLGVQQVIQVKP